MGLEEDILDEVEGKQPKGLREDNSPNTNSSEATPKYASDPKPASSTKKTSGTEHSKTKWEEFVLANTIKELNKDDTGLTDDGLLDSEFIDEKAGAYSTTVKRYKHPQNLDDPDARTQRALRMQADATELHSRVHGDEKKVDLKGLIAKDETVVQVIKTIGFEKFPGSGDSLMGDGMVILTDKNIYFHHLGQSCSASGDEASFGSTACPSICCGGVRGCCACVESCKMMWGSYTHVATRETRTALVSVNIDRQLMDVHAEQIMNSRLERKFLFYPKISVGGCRACCLYTCNQCCMLCGMCRKICDPCILNGFVTFSYDTERNRQGTLEQRLIKEAKVGDSSFWTPFEVEKLMTGVATHGGIDMMDNQKWFDLVSAKIPNRTIDQCKNKHRSLSEGFSASETCRMGNYRALYIPFKDASGTGKVREAVAVIDANECGTQELYQFVLSSNKIKNAGINKLPVGEVLNSMDDSGYPSRRLRDKVLNRSVFGMNLGFDLVMFKFW